MNNNSKLNHAVEQIKSVLDNLWYCGYDVTVSLNNENIVISINTLKNANMMPILSINPEITDDNKLYLDSMLKFPDLTSVNFDYTDGIEYWIKQWVEVGKLITEINKFVYDFEKWKYDEKNDEWYY